MPVRLPLLALLVTASPAIAAEPSSELEQPRRVVHDMFNRPERIPFSRTVDDLREQVEAGNGLFSRLSFAVVGQYASESLTGRDGLVNFTYDLDGAFRVFHDEATGDYGGLTWWIRGGAPIGASSDADLGDDIGSGTGINDALQNDPIVVAELYWVQKWGDLSVSAGRMDATWRYDFNRIANDERESFFGASFDNNPAIPFPDTGPAVNLVWDAGDQLRFKAGVHQANSRANAVTIGELRADELFWAFETIVVPHVDGLADGTYRMTLWYNRHESEGQDGPGVAFSFDQEVGGGLVPFFRYGYADPTASNIRQSISVGLGIEESFGRPDDLFGIGWSWNEPSDRTRNDEQIVEAFYRIGVNRFLALTPDVQVILTPADNPVDDVVVVVGLRAQFSF